MADVLVLNAGYEKLHMVSLKHAIRMLWRGVAVVEEEGPEMFGPILAPKVLRLVRYVKMGWKYVRETGKARYTEACVKVTWEHPGTPTFSYAGVIKRDHGQCAYCGQPGADTVDHVVPKAQGGESSWENCVAAHGSLTAPYCNSRKADRTPQQAGMPLLWQPFVPTVADLAW